MVFYIFTIICNLNSFFSQLHINFFSLSAICLSNLLFLFLLILCVFPYSLQFVVIFPFINFSNISFYIFYKFFFFSKISFYDLYVLFLLFFCLLIHFNLSFLNFINFTFAFSIYPFFFFMPDILKRSGSTILTLIKDKSFELTLSFFQCHLKLLKRVLDIRCPYSSLHSHCILVSLVFCPFAASALIMTGDNT